MRGCVIVTNRKFILTLTFRSVVFEQRFSVDVSHLLWKSRTLLEFSLGHVWFASRRLTGTNTLTAATFVNATRTRIHEVSSYLEAGRVQRGYEG